MNIELDKDIIKSLIFVCENYKNRIMYLEREGKISKKKLNEIKKDTLFNVLKAKDILGMKLCSRCKGSGIYEGKLCLDCGGD